MLPLIEIVVVKDKKYKLQHPGNREWLRLKQTIYDVKNNTLNLEKLLDYAFQNMVFPDGHTFEPTLDNISMEESEVWEVVLPNFFRGKIDAKYKYKEKTS